MHDSLACLLAKGGLKVLSVVLAQEVARNGLSAILVYSLKHLVAGGVTQTGEQRDKLSCEGCGGLVLEDDLVQLACASNLRSCSAS